MKLGLPPPEVMNQFRNLSESNRVELKKPPTPEEKKLAELSGENDRLKAEITKLTGTVESQKGLINEANITIQKQEGMMVLAEKRLNFKQEVEVRGVKIRGHFDKGYDTYCLYFPDVKLENGINDQIIMVSTEPEIAKKAFNHAIELASAGKTTEEVYKESEDYIDNLEIPSEKKVGENFYGSAIGDL